MPQSSSNGLLCYCEMISVRALTYLDDGLGVGIGVGAAVG